MLQKMQLLFFSPGLLNQLVLGIVNPTGVRMGGYGERGGWLLFSFLTFIISLVFTCNFFFNSWCKEGHIFWKYMQEIYLDKIFYTSNF